MTYHDLPLRAGRWRAAVAGVTAGANKNRTCLPGWEQKPKSSPLMGFDSDTAGAGHSVNVKHKTPLTNANGTFHAPGRGFGGPRARCRGVGLPPGLEEIFEVMWVPRDSCAANRTPFTWRVGL